VHFVRLFLSPLLEMHGPKNKIELSNLNLRQNHSENVKSCTVFFFWFVHWPSSLHVWIFFSWHIRRASRSRLEFQHWEQ